MWPVTALSAPITDNRPRRHLTYGDDDNGVIRSAAGTAAVRAGVGRGSVVAFRRDGAPGVPVGPARWCDPAGGRGARGEGRDRLGRRLRLAGDPRAEQDLETGPADW